MCEFRFLLLQSLLLSPLLLLFQTDLVFTLLSVTPTSQKGSDSNSAAGEEVGTAFVSSIFPPQDNYISFNNIVFVFRLLSHMT